MKKLFLLLLFVFLYESQGAYAERFDCKSFIERKTIFSRGDFETKLQKHQFYCGVANLEDIIRERGNIIEDDKVTFNYLSHLSDYIWSLCLTFTKDGWNVYYRTDSEYIYGSDNYIILVSPNSLEAIILKDIEYETGSKNYGKLRRIILRARSKF